jgi:hypothetical protein
MSINPSEATMMMAPSAAVGSGVKKSRKTIVSAAAISPTHCVYITKNLVPKPLPAAQGTDPL